MTHRADRCGAGSAFRRASRHDVFKSNRLLNRLTSVTRIEPSASRSSCETTRDAYYDQLKLAQRGALDITAWLLWFVSQVRVACEKAVSVVDVSLTSTSRATASRELVELAGLGLLRMVGAGRSTRYYIDLDGWVPPNGPPSPRAGT